MDGASLASLLVAAVAAAGAWASQRAASKASTKNVDATSRVEMEKEAYDRARSYDTETIKRQDEEIKELREDNKRLHAEVQMLMQRIARLERGIPTEVKERPSGAEETVIQYGSE
jgi:predicted RNase H-like nuclease (RuvC/YqgF family)